MTKNKSLKWLKIFMGILATAPLFTGLLGLTGNYNPIYTGQLADDPVLLDSNLRFLNGMSVGIGLAVYAVIPTIEKEKLLYRMIWLTIFIGGIGRLLSVYYLGLPPFPMPVFILIEVLCPPLFVYWHYKAAS